ncbi:uncharacterized protein ACNS7B_012105 isoform 1-T1 [Menidia menidia]
MSILNSRRSALASSLLFCLLQGFASGNHVIATVGADVTLRCNYDAKSYGRLSVCWGRGAIPNSGCASEVMRTDGTSVVSRLSERYLLLGNLGEGDVSLTIKQVQEKDSGVYGCRVDIPGWFNDQKHEMTLTVNAGSPYPLSVQTTEVTQRTVTVSWTPSFDGGRPITDFIILLKNKHESWDSALRTELSQPQLTQVTLMDLRPATAYNIKMFALNSVGISGGSNVLTLNTKEAAPDGPPLDMTLEAISSRSIKVTWKPPKPDLRNGVIRSYIVDYKEYKSGGDLSKQWMRLTVTATRQLESAILKNLKPSTKYAVLIKATTTAGVSPASTAPLCPTLDEVQETTTSSSIAATVWIQETSVTSEVLPATAETTSSASIVWEMTTTSYTSATSFSVPPDPPVLKLKEVKDNIISFSWTPGFEGESSITSYLLEYKAANASWDYTTNVVDYSPSQREATIVEMNPSTYNMRMFAKNYGGSSTASNVLTVTTGEAGHSRDRLIPTISDGTPATMVAEDSLGTNLAAVIVPVVLVVLIGVAVTAWQIKRMKQKRGSLIMWLTNGTILYKGSETLEEL